MKFKKILISKTLLLSIVLMLLFSVGIKTTQALTDADSSFGQELKTIYYSVENQDVTPILDHFVVNSPLQPVSAGETFNFQMYAEYKNSGSNFYSDLEVSYLGSNWYKSLSETGLDEHLVPERSHPDHADASNENFWTDEGYNLMVDWDEDLIYGELTAPDVPGTYRLYIYMLTPNLEGLHQYNGYHLAYYEIEVVDDSYVFLEDPMNCQGGDDYWEPVLVDYSSLECDVDDGSGDTVDWCFEPLFNSKCEVTGWDIIDYCPLGTNTPGSSCPSSGDTGTTYIGFLTGVPDCSAVYIDSDSNISWDDDCNDSTDPVEPGDEDCETVTNTYDWGYTVPDPMNSLCGYEIEIQTDAQCNTEYTDTEQYSAPPSGDACSVGEVDGGIYEVRVGGVLTGWSWDCVNSPYASASCSAQLSTDQSQDENGVCGTISSFSEIPENNVLCSEGMVYQDGYTDSPDFSIADNKWYWWCVGKDWSIGDTNTWDDCSATKPEDGGPEDGGTSSIEIINEKMNPGIVNLGGTCTIEFDVTGIAASDGTCHIYNVLDGSNPVDSVGYSVLAGDTQSRSIGDLGPKRNYYVKCTDSADPTITDTSETLSCILNPKVIEY